MFCPLAKRTALCRNSSLSKIIRSMHTSSPARAAQLTVTPSVALVDDPVIIRVTGLHSKQPVTLAASVGEAGLHISHGHYTADEDGVVDVSVAASCGGTYTGREPMGLFWAMEPADGERVGLRLMKRDVTTPFLVQFQVREGHVAVSSAATLDDRSGEIARASVERWYMGPGVRRVTVRHGKLRGTLFLPAGAGPFPGVIDMFGMAGGVVEFRAALLASRGFAVYALPYFAYEDLPRTFKFNLEYFEDAVDYLSSHPSVKKPGIGVIGVSMGSDYAFYMAIAKKQVIACVPINGFYFYAMSHLYKNGRPFPSAMPDVTQAKSVKHEGVTDIVNYQDCFRAPEGCEEAAIKVEEAGHCEFLLVHSEADGMVGTYHRDMQVERFRRHGCTNYRVLSLPGAGHLLEPPYTPLSNLTYHKMFFCVMEYGGKMDCHAKAQECSWREIQDFLHAHLDHQKPRTKL